MSNDSEFIQIGDALPSSAGISPSRFANLAASLVGVGDYAVFQLLREFRTPEMDARLEDIAKFTNNGLNLEQPFAKIYQRAARHMSDYVRSLTITDKASTFADGRGDTPIELALHAAIIVEARFGGGIEFEVISPRRGERFNWQDGSTRNLVIESQIDVEGRRVDFVVSVLGENGPEYLVVECDGHEYHERTPQQAARDHAHVWALQSSGTKVRRFTGTQIWRDPCGCADQVIQWAGMAVFRGAED